MRFLVPMLAIMCLGAVQPSFADPQSIEVGRAHFQSRCATCHGVNADGQSRLGSMMQPRPPSLIASTMSAAAMRRIVTEGGAAVGRSDQMPPWKDELSSAHIAGIIDYVQSVRTGR